MPPIQIYQPTIAPGSVQLPRAQPQPIVNGVGTALSDFGDRLQRIADVQLEHQRALKVSEAVTKFQTGLDDAEAEATQNIPAQVEPDGMPSQFKVYSERVQGLKKSLLEDDNYKDVADVLAAKLDETARPEMHAFSVQAHKAVEGEQAIQLKNQNQQIGAIAGADYTVKQGSNGAEFDSGPKALDQLTRQAHTINQLYPPDVKPAENQAAKQEMMHNLYLQRGMTVALKDPSLIADFLKNSPVTFKPEEQVQMLTAATSAIRRPMTNLDAANDATRASLMDGFNKAAVAGNLDVGRLEDAARHRLVTPEDYERLRGVPFAQPSDPGSVDAAQKLIQGATNADELDAFRVGIASNPNIRGKDSIALEGAIQLRKNEFKTVGGKAKKQAYDDLKRAYQGIPNAFLYNKIAPISGGLTLDQLHANAMADFNVEAEGETDPVKIREAYKKALQNNKPDLSIVNPKKAVAPAPPISNADAKKLGRSLGIPE